MKMKVKESVPLYLQYVPTCRDCTQLFTCNFNGLVNYYTVYNVSLHFTKYAVTTKHGLRTLEFSVAYWVQIHNHGHPDVYVSRVMAVIP